MNFSIFKPNTYINNDTKKNLKERPKKEAAIKTQNDVLNNPADIVKTLYGMGVKAAPKTAKNRLSE